MTMSPSEPVSALERRGLLLVLSSPSGAGKTTIARRLFEVEADRLHMSVSHTTRPQRASEVEGRHYHFVDEAAFLGLRSSGAFIESAEVFGHWYGSARAPVERALDKGRDVIFDIDWQGTQQLTRSMPDDLVRVFILPPSFSALEERLRRRSQDSEAVVARRMARAADELGHYREYDYLVVNADLAQCVREVRAVLQAERLRRERRKGLDGFVARLISGAPAHNR